MCLMVMEHQPGFAIPPAVSYAGGNTFVPGRLDKSLEMGKGKEGGKKEKTRKFGENITFKFWQYQILKLD